MIDELHAPSTINYKVNEAREDFGHFILAYNKTTNEFILHVRIASDFLSTNNRKAVILGLGFQQSRGCDFFKGSECYWIKFFERKNYNRYEDSIIDREVDYAHSLFEKFSREFSQICDHVIALRNLIPEDYIHLPSLTYSFEVDPKLFEVSGDVPTWIEKEAPKEQIELRDEILGKISVLKDNYVSFAELLYQTGDPLELAVKKFFDFLEMKTELAEKSFPIDLFAKKSEVKFAIEVTGVSGNINNKDRKVGQAITYAGEKQEGEKIILAANTYRRQPVEERPSESFTKEAVKILTPFKVCMTTTVTLYTLWKDVIQGRRTKEEVMKSLRETNGILK